MRRLKNKLLILALSLCLCLFGPQLIPAVLAHSIGQSYFYFQIGQDTLTAHAEMPMKDLNRVLNLELPEDRKLADSEVEPLLGEIRAYVEEHTDVSCAPQTCNLAFTGKANIANAHGKQYLQMFYDITGFDTVPDTLQVKYDPILVDRHGFTNMLLIDNNWKTGTFNEEANIILQYDQPGETRTLDLSDGSIFQGLSAIFALGFKHILEGIDHVLFLIALLLPAVVRREDGRWKPVEKFSSSLIYIVKVATTFTVAHSITLGLATLQVVDLSPRLVESIIAASIGLAALDIFYPIFRNRIFLIIFIFGLFHGFGFASVLADLGVTSQYAFLSLLAFNVGVEVGQLCIIAVVFPLLYLIRKQFFYRGLVLKTGGALLGVMSLYWLIERVFDINIRVLPFFQGLLA